MKIKSNMLLFPILMVITPAVVVMDSPPADQQDYATTRDGAGINLNGKMFTLSRSRGGIRFYSPYHPPPWLSSTLNPTRSNTSPYYSTSRPPTATHQYTQNSTPTITPQTTPGYTRKTATTNTYSTTPKTTTRTTPRTTYPPRTTAPPTSSVSVCLRYITDYLQTQSPSIFTLSPYSTPLKFEIMGMASYSVTDNTYNSVYLQPSIRVWSDIGRSMWTNVCLTVDTAKNVVQMFKDSNMSMRKLLPYRYVWSGEPVIDFSGFDGQVTDVQVWDYPLGYKEVFYYLSGGKYGAYQGSVLTWSYINYSPSGNTLLEDNYEQQIKQPRGQRRRHLRGKQMHRKLLSQGETKQKRKLMF